MKKIAKNTIFGLAVITLLSALLVTPTHAWFWGDGEAEQLIAALELQWEDLVPKDFIPAPNPLDTMSQIDLNKLFDGSPESVSRLAEIEMTLAYAPTVPELNGKQVKIPGFVVPLDYDGQTELSEFLLVPYFGACIHSPPPPANQVVLAKSESTVIVEDIYEPVWVIGTLETETVKSELAESGYTLQIKAIEAYRQSQNE